MNEANFRALTFEKIDSTHSDSFKTNFYKSISKFYFNFKEINDTKIL